MNLLEDLFSTDARFETQKLSSKLPRYP